MIDRSPLADGLGIATCHIEASDPDAGDTLTYSIDGSPARVSIDSNGDYTWDGDVVSAPTFTVRVSDGNLGEDSVAVTVTP